MDHIRMRDDDRSPPPTENSTAPLIRERSPPSTPNRRESDAERPPWYPPPSTANSQFTDKSPPRSKLLIQGFEKPSFSRIAILTALCLITYPAFYGLKSVAKDRSLFIVRLIVSVWCSGLGFALGYILLKIGARHLEAATWATVIHMSDEGDGMKLHDLARGSSNPASFMPAFHLFRSRSGNQETATLRSRKSHDHRPWSLFLGFFVVLAILAPLLPFLFGRIMVIKTFVRNQREVYHEVLITGDLTREDVERAALRREAPGISELWPLFPDARSVSDTTEFVYDNDTVSTVYFAQPSLSQFTSGGSGVGTFKPPVPLILKNPPNNTLTFTGGNAPKVDNGTILRYPQWGLKVHCKKLPNPKVNLVPEFTPNATHIFVPRDFLQDLFGAYGVDPLMELPDLQLVEYAYPSNINSSTISHVAQFNDDGRSMTIDYIITASGNQGWLVTEIVLIRLNTLSAPSGRFPVYTNVSSPWVESRIGYDAAVCVQKYEPWIVEAYNTSITSPSTLRIVEKAYGITSLTPSGNIREAPVTGTRYLNTSEKYDAFEMAYIYGRDSLEAANMPADSHVILEYHLTPTILSLANGTEPWGYTEFSPDRLAVVRARVSAASTLPYLVGSGLVVAQSYEDETVAFTVYKPWQLIILPILIWILGIIGELFVPKLPFNIPRREFGVYSWLALFQSQELQFEAADDLVKLTSLEELEEKFSDKRVKFVLEKGEI